MHADDQETPDWLSELVRGREFKVGNRVRVRLNPECHLYGYVKYVHPASGHPMYEDGFTGYIAVDRSSYDSQHPYLVFFDTFKAHGDWLAPQELEPLDEPDAIIFNIPDSVVIDIMDFGPPEEGGHWSDTIDRAIAELQRRHASQERE